MLSQTDPGCKSVEVWTESLVSVSPPAHAGHETLFFPRPHQEVVVEVVLGVPEKSGRSAGLPGSRVMLVERPVLVLHRRWPVEPRSSQPRPAGLGGAEPSSEVWPGLVVGPPEPGTESTSA